MRRVEKPIKCLPVSDIQKMGLRCLLLNQSDCSSDSPKPIRGQQMDHRYSRDKLKIRLRGYWSDQLREMISVGCLLGHRISPWISISILVERLSRDQGQFHYSEEPPAVLWWVMRNITEQISPVTVVMVWLTGAEELDTNWDITWSYGGNDDSGVQSGRK